MAVMAGLERQIVLWLHGLPVKMVAMKGKQATHTVNLFINRKKWSATVRPRACW